MNERDSRLAQSPFLAEQSEDACDSAAQALRFDPEAYSHFLADCDWTEVQKVEFTEALWKVIVAAIDLRYGAHPVQRVMNCAKTLEPDSEPMLDSAEHSEIKERNCAASFLREAAQSEDS